MKAVAVLKLPKPASKVAAIARLMVERMTGNPYFPSPSPPLGTIEADITAVLAANAAVLQRTKGNKQARDGALQRLHDHLTQLGAHVQAVADANTAEAEIIIASAGLDVKRPSIRNKPPLRAVQGRSSGMAVLIAKWAGDRASYEWRLSTDGESWSSGGTTIHARTVLSGLKADTRYFFQLRVQTKAGVGDWGDSVSLLVA
jgi:hypothetical protein